MDPLAELVGESPAIETVRDQIRRLVAHRETGRRLPSVLLQGETGSGKGLVARVLHRAGPRARAPFVDLNCAAMPEHLVESELFGYERGAFTDARRAKPGLFQTAHRGVIFLDEIGELREPTQAKLLKVLEEGVVRRLGATETEPADVWVISATNADLEAAVRQRAFREDLYHRLAVLTLRLPPLRERGRDVILLATQFLAQACTEYGLAPKRLASDAEARLLLHPWPGNIRELGNVMERVALLAENDLVTASMLELRGSQAPEGPSRTPAPPPASLETAMRDHLLAALEQTRWNISRTAALLDISRNTVRARIERFGLRPQTPAPSARRPSRREATVSPEPSDESPALGPVRAGGPSAPLRWESRRITFLRAVLITPEGADPLVESNRILDALLEKTQSFGGHIEELSPHAIGAVFGVEPVEDAPRRAAHVAMAIQKAAERTQRGGGRPFSVKIGIQVAEALIGQSGSDHQIDAEAKRVQWTLLDSMLIPAGPGSILVSADAVPFLSRRFELLAEGASPISAWRLTGRERRGLAPEGQIARLVGRQVELALLQSRLSTVRAGHGQVVGISGDAGIGKSRLVREFRQKLRGEAVTYLEGHCLSYGGNIPYLPILEILRHACRIADNDPPPRVAQKLRLTLGRLAMDAGETLPYLMRLLGVKEEPEGSDESSPETIRKRTILALRQMCVSAARQQPLVILVEDLHWIDPASEALGSIAEGLTGIPLLLILTYRPEYRPAWLDKSYVTQIGLQPLSPEESLTLLTGSLSQHRLLDTVAREIVSKADGNPFFLEELGRTVREQDDLHISGSVPGTVQEVLLSRINRLTIAQKRLLQCAAVVGKDIPAALLAAIAGADVNVPETIRQLRLAEFIYERNPEPDAEYTFKHALTYDVAYGSLPSRERRDLHARIVDALEQTYTERLSEHVERLADHSYRGELWAKAVRYLREAGAKALSNSANREAAVFFEQALAALAHLGESPETMEQAIDLRFEIRNALTPLGAAPRILEQLGQAQALAERLDDGRRLGRALSFSVNCLYLMGDYPRAIEAGQRAQRIAESLDDPSLKIATEMYLARAHQSLGAYRTAADILRRTVTSLSGPAIHDRLGLPVLPSVFSRSHLVACLTEMGDFGEAGPWADEAIEVAEVTRQPDNLFWAYRALALIHLGRGAGHEAAAVLEPALAACQASELLLYVAAFSSDLGLAYVLSGRVIEGLKLLEHAVGETAGRRQSYHPQALLHLGEGYLEAGRWSDGEDCGQRALELARTRGERGREAHALRLLADLAARGNSLAGEGAQERYGPALTLSDELGMRPSSARCHLGLGLLLSRQGHRAEALASLTQAVRTLEATQMLSWLRQARLALEALG